MRRLAIIFTIIFSWAAIAVHAQSSTIEQVKQDLDAVSSLLREQEHNIVHLEAQLDNISHQQRVLGDSINRCQWQLAQVRSQYAMVVRNLNAHSNAIDKLAFIFSATSLQQAWQRATYLRQLSRWREARSTAITNAIASVNRKQQQLKKLAQARRASLMNCNATRVALQTRLEKVTTLLATLQNQAPQLVAVLNEKKQQASRLASSLDHINTSPSQQSSDALLDAYNLERASLSLPVTGHHAITSHYGRQQHPTLQHITIVNNGIDITCHDQHATVIAVDKGVVTGIYNLQPNASTVMLRHGDYLTVYSGVTQVAVKKGQVVEKQQQLGIVAIDNATHKPLLHFELRHGHTPLDPQPYLKNN